MSLLKITELPDVFADACLRDSLGQILFLSCYGRDTSIQQMLSAFQLPVSQGGLDSFHLVNEQEQRFLVAVGNPDNLTKMTGRLPRENLFGNLVHAWVFNPALQQPDYANRVVWLIDRKSQLQGSVRHERVWALYKQLSPLPLLDHWKVPLLEATQNYVVPLDESANMSPIGDIAAYRIQIGDEFEQIISSLVKQRLLTL